MNAKNKYKISCEMVKKNKTKAVTSSFWHFIPLTREQIVPI